MKAKHVLLGCALTALSTNAVAAADKTGRGYVGVGYTMLTVSPEGGPDLDLGALGVRGGYFFNKYFSVEGRLAFGVADDSLTETVDVGAGPETATLTLDLDYSLGVYAVGHIPLTEQFKLYGLAGFTKHEVTLGATIPSLGSDSESFDDSDFSFGVGAEFDMTNNWPLGVEYVSYFTDGDLDGLKYDTDGIGITLNYIFD